MGSGEWEVGLGTGRGKREEGRSKKGTKGEEGGEERERGRGRTGVKEEGRRTSFTKISVGLADAQRWS